MASSSTRKPSARLTRPSSSKVQTAQDTASTSMPLSSSPCPVVLPHEDVPPADPEIERLDFVRFQCVRLDPRAKRFSSSNRPLAGSDELNLRMSDLDHGVEVRAAERFVHRCKPLHVLLRHRLLPQPHGFEGFCPTQIRGRPSDQPRPRSRRRIPRPARRSRTACLAPRSASPRAEERCRPNRGTSEASMVRFSRARATHLPRTPPPRRALAGDLRVTPLDLPQDRGRPLDLRMSSPPASQHGRRDSRPRAAPSTSSTFSRDMPTPAGPRLQGRLRVPGTSASARVSPSRNQ